jgi:hypothetical protein
MLWPPGADRGTSSLVAQPQHSRASSAAVIVLDWLAALLVTALGLALLLNGSFFSAYDAHHVDLSINLTAAHAMRDGDNPYGIDTLFERAEALGSPTTFIYNGLYTSYIQPPTSALTLLPLTTLPWRDATHAYLYLNHVFLFAAVGLTLYTLRPALPVRWLVAGSAVILALYSQIYASFALGQVDATILLLLSISFWAFMRGLAPVAGGAIAVAAAIKLLPALLLLYFIWKREYRAALWGFGIGFALLILSAAYVGTDTYETYLRDTVPGLLNGSTHYSNAGVGAVIARASTDGTVNDVPDILSLNEVPSDNTARAARTLVSLGAIALLALVIPRGRGKERSLARLLPEFYLVVGVALIISSVTWEFYVIWLLPVFLAAFLAPDRILPGGAVRLACIAALAVAFVMLNYPGDCGSSRDCYLFEPNTIFYRPDWVPGVWVERQVGLYANHLDAVVLLRLPGLMLVAGILAALVLHWRFRSGGDDAEAADEAPAPNP